MDGSCFGVCHYGGVYHRGNACHYESANDGSYHHYYACVFLVRTNHVVVEHDYTMDALWEVLVVLPAKWQHSPDHSQCNGQQTLPPVESIVRPAAHQRAVMGLSCS